MAGLRELRENLFFTVVAPTNHVCSDSQHHGEIFRKSTVVYRGRHNAGAQIVENFSGFLRVAFQIVERISGFLRVRRPATTVVVAGRACSTMLGQRIQS